MTSSVRVQAIVWRPPKLCNRAVAASAFLVNTVDTTNINPDPPTVTRIDPTSVAHIHYGFSGPNKKLLVCVDTARAALKVHFSINQQVPIREP
jgi:hypothetical protein